MTTSSVRIALPKLFLWSEAARIQEYPEALSRVEEGRTYTRLEIERELYDVAPTLTFQHGSPRGSRTDGIVNLYGIERSGDRWRLNGLGLFNRTAGKAIASADGLRLGAIYRESPQRNAWALELARLVAMREPRTRLVLWLMVRGAELRADLSDSGTNTPIDLAIDADNVLTIQWARTDAFNDLLQEHAVDLLGPFWSETIGLNSSDSIAWEGVVRGNPPSTNSLSTALRRSLSLFHHIGLFEGSGVCWNLSFAQVDSVLGDAISRSLGYEGASAAPLSDDEAFAQAIRECAGADGFVTVSQLAERFGQLLDVPGEDRAAVLDSFARTAMYHDHLRVVDRHPGQPRMGRGLFGEPASRRIRVDFTPINSAFQVRTADDTAATSQIQGEDR